MLVSKTFCDIKHKKNIQPSLPMLLWKNYILCALERLFKCVCVCVCVSYRGIKSLSDDWTASFMCASVCACVCQIVVSLSLSLSSGIRGLSEWSAEVNLPRLTPNSLVSSPHSIIFICFLCVLPSTVFFWVISLGKTPL